MSRAWKTREDGTMYGHPKGIRHHKGVRKKRRGHRPAGILWDFNGDGRFSHEIIPRYWKNYWERQKRRRNRKKLQEQLNDSNRNRK